MILKNQKHYANLIYKKIKMIIAEMLIPSYSKKYFMRKEMYDELASKSDKFYFINCHTLVDKEKISHSKKIFEQKYTFVSS